MGYRTILIAGLLLLPLVCGVSAETGGDLYGYETNVYFCKLVPEGDNYMLEPLPTLYLGKNSLGRLIFASGTDKLEEGDYALVQETSDGFGFIQSLTIEPSGTGTPEYVILKLEIRESDLKAPLEYTGAAVSEPMVPETTVPGTPDMTYPSSTATVTSQPESTKTPLSTVSVIMAGLIAVMCVFVLRNRD